MRHNCHINHLGRKAGHRKALLSNLAISLILRKRITTTVAKAKALREFVEPLISRTKEDSTHSRREIFKRLGSKEAVSELFREVAVKVANRPGGYTRILRIGNRPGDNAEMCFIELVDYNENMLSTTSKAKPAAKKSRRGGAKKKADAPVAEAPESPSVESNE
jgi:large subunit ribosomal protein L17